MGTISCANITASGTPSVFTSTGDTSVKIIANNFGVNYWPTLDFIRQKTSDAFGGDEYEDWRIRNNSGQFTFSIASTASGTAEVMRLVSLGMVATGVQHIFTSTGTTNVKIISDNTNTNTCQPTLDFIRQNSSESFTGDTFVDWRLKNDNGNFLFINGDSSTGPVEMMRITSTGLVGIGTTNPLAPLHIVGKARSITFASQNVFGEYLPSSSGSNFTMTGVGITRSISISCDSAVLANGFYANSDRRFKKNITDLDLRESLNFVKTINPKKYNLIHEDDTQHKSIGYIAQDLKDYISLLSFSEREQFPKQNEDDIENVALSVDYSKICTLLHTALQSVLKDLDSLYEAGSYAAWRKQRS